MKLFFRRHPYLLSLVTVTFSLLARLALDAWLADQVSYALFFVAITISAMYGSIRASIVATILGGFAVYYFVIPPRHHWGFQTPAFFVGFVQYLLAAATIIWLSRSRANAWQQTEHNLLRLHESKEQLRIALGAAGMGTWYWNLVTDIVTCDSRCRELFGMADDDRASSVHIFLDRLHIDDRQRTWEALQNAVAFGKDYDEILRVIWSDQTTRWLRCKGRVDMEGEKKVLGGVWLDVTAGKQNEEARRSHEGLGGAARLGHALAHEINNPLQIIINTLFILRREPLDRYHHELAATSLHAADRLARITQHMLSLDSHRSHPTHIRISDVINAVVEEHKHAARDRDVSVIKRFHYDGEVLVVPEDLRKVCANLLLNSIESFQNGGKVIVDVLRSTDWKKGESRLRVVFADNGPGIPDEIRPLLFQPFTTTKPESASGLGLWVTRGILRKYGAAVRYRSSTAPGRTGTCIAVSFPEGELRRQRIPPSSSAAAAS